MPSSTRSARVAEYTRPATWEDVKRVAGYLEEAGVEYALIGGYALAAHGLVRLTEDIDVLVNPAAANSRRWIVKQYAIRINDEFTIDILPGAAGIPWSELEPYVEDMMLDDVRLRVLNLEGLLKTKSGARPKDQADAAAIRHALEKLGR